MNGYCNTCGNALPPAARFCPSCGAVVTGAPPAGYAPPYGAMPFGSPFGPPPVPPRLVRPLYGRQFAGVCIGLSRTYGWDVALVRILAVLLGIFVCPIPEIFYLAGWIGIPEESIAEVPPPQV